MSRLTSTITTLACAAGLAMGLAAIAPANAAGPATTMNSARAAIAPLMSPASVVQVQEGGFGYRYRHLDRRNRDWRHRDWRGPRHHNPRRDYRPRSGFSFQYRQAPRHYEPPPRQAYRLPAAHVRWCDNRYRSYRASDNSFQPYNGPRRQCRSPYL